MKDFIFRNDTKLFFRNDIRETISEITQGHKVMFVYGEGSVKQNGCHADIVQTLRQNGVPFIEYGNSSREFQKIQEGIRLAKANGITLIIGAGGASVMDSAKLMAFGFYHETDLWDYIKGKAPYGLKRLPLALIPTYPSSGSENGLRRLANRRFRNGLRYSGRLCDSLPPLFADFRPGNDGLYRPCHFGPVVCVHPR